MSLNTLLADIGGTNTRIALAQDGKLRENTIRRYRNAEHSGLDSALDQYKSDQETPMLDGVCVDIAGPVTNGVGTLTNLDWTLEETLISEWTGASKARLINDLQAQGHGAADLPQDALHCVIEGAGHVLGRPTTRLVVNVGTGFNAAVVLEDHGQRLVPPSESGHANLPIRTDDELRLCKFLENIHGFPAVEDVLSGRGLERSYSWLASEDNDTSQRSSTEIIQDCLAQADPRAEEAVRLFTRIFGTVTGNLALIHLPFGGIYLVGGVAVALGRHLHQFGFADAMRDKGRFSGMMTNFPIHVIEDDYAALRGAAHFLHFELTR